MREAKIVRKTAETDMTLALNLDGRGKSDFRRWSSAERNDYSP